jgi:hypothetical protein
MEFQTEENNQAGTFIVVAVNSLCLQANLALLNGASLHMQLLVQH